MSARSSAPQSFANHRAIPPLWLFLSGLVILAELARRVWLAIQNPSFESIWLVVFVAAILGTWHATRSNALIVQDRVIRLEMRLRLERVIGANRRADIERLPLTYLIALRFASDAEMPALFDDALAGKFAKVDDLKKRIQTWQPDWLRV
ncbi:MAG: DUF6526 family protein [Planctomycetota bacterium]|nr:DUF6526 family protein [Planctomycetota bacterium]